MLLVLIMTLLIGRRKIGELPVFDFIVIITLGSIIGADIADLKIQHLLTAYAIVLLLSIQYIYSKAILKYRRFGNLVSFDPVVVIENGQFVKGNLKKIKYSIDNILMLLRDKGVSAESIFYVEINTEGEIYISEKSRKIKEVHNIRH